jgi:hypothetical protein
VLSLDDQSAPKHCIGGLGALNAPQQCWLDRTGFEPRVASPFRVVIDFRIKLKQHHR